MLPEKMLRSSWVVRLGGNLVKFSKTFKTLSVKSETDNMDASTSVFMIVEFCSKWTKRQAEFPAGNMLGDLKVAGLIAALRK